MIRSLFGEEIGGGKREREVELIFVLSLDVVDGKRKTQNMALGLELGC